MNGWCIAFCVLLVVVIILFVYLVRLVIGFEIIELLFCPRGVMVVNINGGIYSSINAPVNQLISTDNSNVLYITNVVKSTTVTNGYSMSGYVVPTPKTMNILNVNNPATTPLVTEQYNANKSPTSFSFTGLTFTATKPMNIDLSALPVTQSSLPAYTLTTNDTVYTQ